MKKISLIILLFSIPFVVNAQQKRIITFATISNGDTIPMSYLKEVTISGYIAPLTDSEKIKYAKLIRNVKKTYPFAKQAGKLLESYSIAMKDMPEKQKKKLMKQAEDEINLKFSSTLKKLSKSQGKVLIRLVDRETGSDSYSIVKELRGSFRAFFYQSLGKLFGYNLHSRYNPQYNEEDKIIEKIIYGIETKTI
ncbi:MAG: DUF4294 domain-containing protein [Bacteroidales bacterium]|jgi:hypothetical protein|nr:DUF4294 domain-containing protein [Bacteroidales bacterium]MDD4001309.1 DUF4294 domain-containing protein [Bacteroidales bacterium]MDD4529305.1 DUF4294 domain-containing protein [Bacteroidales bacterium]MDD4829226.1 DUF4294 domain-containing protein [Bacteroidales bacterium]